MKCVYHPTVEAEERCSICNVPFCSECSTEASLNEGRCKTCRHQIKIQKIYQIVRFSMCGAGLVWAVLAFILFEGDTMTKISYGLYGILGVLVINFVSQFIFMRLLLSNLKPHQKVFVGLARYAATGHKVFLDQALNNYDKIKDKEQYRDALFDQIVSIIILQPYDFPKDWVEYFSETFDISQEELLEGMLEFGQDVFYENIINRSHYQAMEPYFQIIKRTENHKLFHEFMDEIVEKVQQIDIKKLSKPEPIQIPGTDKQETPVRDPQAIQDKAFLTELKLLEKEIETFLTDNDREEDWETIKAVIKNFKLPPVPKSTFEAAKQMATRQQTQQQLPSEQLPEGEQVIETAEPSAPVIKDCAECGNAFPVNEMETYTFNDISVKVCRKCREKLEEEGHRELTLLAELRESTSSPEDE
ncbi:MAG: hypothetical protein U9O98_09420 [Asgard group archaeon]|nr:hypothetical protein [Asgard group archaeon]